MMDAVRQNLGRSRRAGRARLPAPRSYYLATIHRQENTDDCDRLAALIGALERLPHPVLLPLHPRTRERLSRMGRKPSGAVRVTKPVSYLEMLALESRARAILTDSGSPEGGVHPRHAHHHAARHHRMGGDA
jgi:UDP-N-acetylglucosamine 2-epimerase